MTLRQLNMYLWVSLMWGTSLALLVPVVESLDWAASVSFRAFIASLTVFLIAKATKRKLEFAGHWKLFAVLGFTSVGMNLGGLNYAIDHLGTQLAAILVATIPLFGLLIESIWSKTWPPILKTLGLVIGFSGVVILIGLSPQTVNKEFWLGVTGSLIGAFGFALGGNFSKFRGEKVGSWEQTIGTFLFGGLWTLPVIAIVPIVHKPSATAIICLIAVALSASSLAYILYFKLVAEVGATTALTTEFLVPVVAVILGYLIYSESLTTNQIIGSAIIMLGCALVMGLNPFQKFQFAKAG